MVKVQKLNTETDAAGKDIDYLLKPIDEDELEHAVKQYQERLPKQQSVTLDFNDIKNLLVNPIEREYKKRFSVKVGQHLKLINIDDIECFYSENKGTYLYTSEGRNYLLDTTLEHLEQELDPHLFFRINRQMIINKKVIYSFKTIENRKTTLFLREGLKNGFGDIIISRYKSAAFKKWYNFQNGNE